MKDLRSHFQLNRFHWLVIIGAQFTGFFGTQNIFGIFTSYIPQWRCLSPSENSTLQSSFSRDCGIYESCPKSDIEFEHIGYYHSAAVEFNWICGGGLNAYLAELNSQIHYAGMIIGSLMFGMMSDYWGRKRIAVGLIAVGTFLFALSGFSPNWQTFMAARFVCGFFDGGTSVAVFTYQCECILPQQRILLFTLPNWGNARLMLVTVCYFFPDWRTSTFVCAALYLPGLLQICFAMPESPTWLKNKGRIEEMDKSKAKMAWIAGEDVGNVVEAEVEGSDAQEPLGMMQLFKDWNILKRLLVLLGMWFTLSIAATVIDLHTSSLSGNLFLNQALFGILTSASKSVTLLLDTYLPNFSRRNLHQWSQFALNMCFVALTTLAIFGIDNPAILVINLLSVVLMEYTWDACDLCSIESMPTEMRSFSNGACYLVARVGSFVAPTFLFLSKIWPPGVYVASLACGALGFLISYFGLTETKGVRLDKVMR